MSAESATYKNELIIEFPQKCECCSGTGTVKAELSLVNLLDILEATDGTHNKINYIKAIRARWSLGLREAKTLAEAAIDFKENALASVNINILR